MDYALLAEPLMDLALLLPREYWTGLGNIGVLQASTDKSDAQALWRRILKKCHQSLCERKKVTCAPCLPLGQSQTVLMIRNPVLSEEHLMRFTLKGARV